MIELLGSSLLIALAIYIYSYIKKKKDPDEIKKIPFTDTLKNTNTRKKWKKHYMTQG